MRAGEPEKRKTRVAALGVAEARRGAQLRRLPMTVGVHPLAGFDKLLHYQVPVSLREQVTVGALVRIPIVNRFHLGIVAEFSEPKDFPVARCKPLAGVVYPFPAMPPDLLRLAKWMSAYYAAPLDGIIETMLPGAVRKAAALKQEKLLAVARELAPDEEAALAKRAPAQAKVYAFLRAQGRPVAKALTLERLAVSAAAVGGLVSRGLVREMSRRVERIAYADDHAAGEHVAAQPHRLNAEQQAAVDAVGAALRRKNSACNCSSA